MFSKFSVQEKSFPKTHHTTADTYETHSDTLCRVISNVAEKVVYFRRMLLLHGELEKILRPHCQSSLKYAQGATAMGLFNSRKKQEQAYITALDIPSCLKEDFKLVVEETFTIVGIGTVATGHVLTGMCRIGEKAYVITLGTTALETTITTIDVHTKERQSNGCAYKTEHIGLGLRGISKEQLEKGTEIIVKNANQYAM